MQINLLNQRYREGFVELKTATIKRKWDILILVVDGEYSMRFTDSGKKLILRKNDIALIPAEVEFERKVAVPLTSYIITFFPEVEHPFYRSASPGKLKLPSDQAGAIFKMIERAFILPDNREIITHIVEHIFAENYLFGERKKAKFKPFSEEINKVIQYMRNNLDKKIDIDELAALVYLSHSGLIWKFKQELNTTPSNYLKILRLRYAKQLLLNYPYSITEISEMCGYSSPYYFTNAFHQHTGMSPTEFRKHYLEEK